MDDLEQRVLTFGVRHLAAHEVILGPTFVDDLGSGGDDVVDLFQSFGTEFAVDLTELYGFWDPLFIACLSGGHAPIRGADLVTARPRKTLAARTLSI